MALPDFLIVGAMKCGTSTLAAQLGAQPGIFMTTPKEPNFFSDDAVHAKGLPWYEHLFEGAKPGDLKGEASTHYTKLPTHPGTLPRLKAALEARGAAPPRILYLIRDPVERAVSHYIHEWTMGVMAGDIAEAFERHPELVAYSRYGFQIAPWTRAFGPEGVLVLGLEALQAAPEETLGTAAGFLGYGGTARWQEDQARANASAERIRQFPLHGLLFDNPVAAALRRALVPQALRDRIKRSRQMRARPVLPDGLRARLEATFAEDHAELMRLLPGRGDLRASYPFLAP
jgi:hypothetical protein